MPAATATRARRAPAPVRAPAPRPPLKVVAQRRRPPVARRRRVVLLCALLSVGSLLLVAAAQAYLTQGQVHLARLQQQLNAEEAHHRDLELRVASLEDPSHVVGQAQQQGLTVPTQVTDLPLVSVGSSPSTTTTVPTTHPTTTLPATHTAGGGR